MYLELFYIVNLYVFERIMYSTAAQKIHWQTIKWYMTMA